MTSLGAAGEDGTLVEMKLGGAMSVKCGRLAAGEGYRDGRWAGFEKDECGIHAGIDGEGI